MFAPSQPHKISNKYHGLILLGHYSMELKKRVADIISQFESLDSLNTPIIPYISAWKNDYSHIWYEFTGNKLAHLLGCKTEMVSETLRNSVIDRCIYKHPHLSPEICKETITNHDLNKSRAKLRNEVVQNGEMEAVYKIAPKNGQHFWLKDQATVESHQQDGICLSLGMLSVVSKEMQAEEALKLAKEELQTHRDQLERIVQDRTQELRKTQLEIVYRLAKAAEYRDKYTGTHITKMSKYCSIIGQAINLKKEYHELLTQAAPMHDIGKIGIPDEILQKPSKLNNQEFQQMKKHSRIGAKLLSGHGSDLLRVAMNIALTHHEKWDGSGYPLGIKGTSIPVAGRIAAICDVFDALTSKRPYKEPWPFEKAVEEINMCKGKHFDPRLVSAFMTRLPQIKAIHQA